MKGRIEWEGLPKKSDYVHIHLPIRTAYEWGSGWRDAKDCNAFEEDIRTLRFGYPKKIEEPRVSGSCPSLTGKTRADKTNLYLHPMEITGYVLKSEIPDLIKELEQMPSIENVCKENLIVTEVYDIKDSGYLRLMMKNMNRIKDWVEDNKKASGLNIGFDFVRENRIERVGDKSCYSSDDLDVAFVESVYEQSLEREKSFDSKSVKEKGEER